MVLLWVVAMGELKADWLVEKLDKKTVVSSAELKVDKTVVVMALLTAVKWAVLLVGLMVLNLVDQ